MIGRQASRPALGALFILVLCALVLFGISSSAGAGAWTLAASDLRPSFPGSGPFAATSTTTPTSTALPVCGLAWRAVSSPNGSEFQNTLQAVAAISADNIWAVGSYGLQGPIDTLVEHWDGSSWSIVPSPNPLQVNELNGISALGPNDIWAVGTVTIHWDGNSWTGVPTPEAENLHSVAAISSNDVWAVGNNILHWNGSAWSARPGAVAGTLYGVAAVSATDVWAVGTYSNGSAVATLIERWDGTQWNLVPSPNGEGFASQLEGITIVAANDAWAVGYNSTDNGLTTLIERWDGIQWNLVPSPNLGSSNLNAIMARTATDIWSVGNAEVTGGTYPPVLEHWDGASWSLVPADNPTDFNSQNGVAIVGADNVWVVGMRLAGQVARTWSMQYSDPCSTTTPAPSRSPTATMTIAPFTATATATATAAPPATSTSAPTITPVATQPGPSATLSATSTSTSTGIPAPTQPAASPTPSSVAGTPSGTPTSLPTPTYTATPPATSTACAIQFIDVPQGSTFYIYIYCLACQGIISGYGDGTFRPNNNVTRGQAAKVLANSAGYNDNIPADRQTFEDVAPQSAFWLYVERVAAHGAISGYPCGQAPGGPCIPPSDRPYFLPNNNLTRGQLAKIDSNVAGYEEPIPSTQKSFQDVSSNNTFWLYIERVYMHGVINGYQCGQAPAGSCLPPDNRPYFLPSSNVTRGQTTKIVSNTFFPECQSLIPTLREKAARR
jgi:hypothetical protein